MPCATSMRKPSTPRSSQNRRTESNSARTSGLSQLRSGCSGANRCRYHCPSVARQRVQAGPPKTDSQSLGGSSPSSPRPAGSGSGARRRPGRSASAARNQACWSEVWLGTMSTMTRRPRSCASPMSSRRRRGRRTADPPRGSRRRRSRRRPAARRRTASATPRPRRAPPDTAAAPAPGRSPTPSPSLSANCADIHLVDDGVAPPAEGRRVRSRATRGCGKGADDVLGHAVSLSGGTRGGSGNHGGHGWHGPGLNGERRSRVTRLPEVDRTSCRTSCRNLPQDISARWPCCYVPAQPGAVLRSRTPLGAVRVSPCGGIGHAAWHRRHRAGRGTGSCGNGLRRRGLGRQPLQRQDRRRGEGGERPQPRRPGLPRRAGVGFARRHLVSGLSPVR